MCVCECVRVYGEGEGERIVTRSQFGRERGGEGRGGRKHQMLSNSQCPPSQHTQDESKSQIKAAGNSIVFNVQYHHKHTQYNLLK